MFLTKLISLAGVIVAVAGLHSDSQLAANTSQQCRCDTMDPWCCPKTDGGELAWVLCCLQASLFRHKATCCDVNATAAPQRKSTHVQVKVDVDY